MKHCLTLLVLLVVAVGCGKSPLLHHLKAENVRPSENRSFAESCPLEFHQLKLCADIAWIEGPSGDSKNSFTLKFWNSVDRNPEGPYVDPPNIVFVQLWMPDMGHGSSPTGVSRKESGVYEVSNVYFIMPATWDIRVQIKKDRELVDQAVLSLNVP